MKNINKLYLIFFFILSSCSNHKSPSSNYVSDSSSNSNDSQTSNTSEDSDFEFSKFGGGYSLVEYNGNDKRVVVPDYYKDKPVIAIGLLGSGSGSLTQPTGFCNNRFVENIILPKYLTAIYNYAFYNCTSLIEIDSSQVLDSYTLGDFVFAGTKKIISYTIDEKINLFYPNTFSNSSLEKICVNRSIGDIAGNVVMFKNCSKLKKIIFGNNATFKAKYSFNIYLVDETTPNVESVIYENAETKVPTNFFFKMYKLKELTIPVLDRNIVDYFGSERKTMKLDVDTYNGELNIPSVQNFRCIETQELKQTFYSPYIGGYIVTLDIPKTWELKDYWFLDDLNEYFYFDDNKDYSLSYGSYTYKGANSDIFQCTINYPDELYGYFTKLCRNLNLTVLKHNENEEEFLLKTGIQINQ